MGKQKFWKGKGFEIMEKRQKREERRRLQEEEEKNNENKESAGPRPVEELPIFDWRTIRNVPVRDKETYCVICCIQFDSLSELNEHLQGTVHRVAYLKVLFMTQKREIMEDKFGIQIYCRDIEPLKDGTIPVQIPNCNESVTLTFIVKNGSQCQLRLRNVDFLQDMKVATLDDDCGMGFGVTKQGEMKKMVVLESQVRYEIKVTCCSKEVGMYYIPLAFEFGFVEFVGGFFVVRYLGLHFSCPFIEKLEGEKAVKKRVRRPMEDGVEFRVPGRPLPKEPSLQKLRSEVKLEQYWPPRQLRRLGEIHEWAMDDPKLLKHLKPEELEMMETLLDLFEDGLTYENYQNVVSSLLHVEEIQMDIDIQQFDIKSAMLRPDNSHQDFYLIDVPGLRENRPSVLRGDHIYVRRRLPSGEFDSTEYEGVVHAVHNVTVKLGFAEEFTEMFVPKMRFGVRFTFSRMPLRMMHFSLENVNPVHYQLLFPRSKDVGSYSPLKDISSFVPFNKKVSGNVQQEQAVIQIVNGSARPVPYLLFGPAGTGKTTTLVEAIKQVWKLIPTSHILVCAPSNSACDTVTERLLEHISPKQMLRMHASSRDPDKISDKVMSCSNYSRKDRAYAYPDKAELMKYRVIIVSLITAGRLVLAAFPQKHFTHVFIDEAGQSVEPEALVPIVGLMYMEKKAGFNGGNLILAGDPRQLGPVLRSPIAAGTKDFVKECGLQKSLLERLMNENPVYQRGPDGHYDMRVLTKLVRNYRSHEKILKLPNDMFYDSELIPCADKLKVNSLCNWEGLPKKGFPIIFHGVMGRDMKEAMSPSCYNPEEICTVVKYVEALLGTKKNGMRISVKDIGIISPYRKQVEKIKWALNHHKMQGITVGSTEEYQGQERRIIIISTVRSHNDVLAMDIELKLGFLKNEKRFNVSMTRAQALLIIIGNPYILVKDKHWGSLLHYCMEHGGYKGCYFEGPEMQAEELYERFERLGMIPDDEDLSANKQFLLPDSAEQSDGPQWRNDDV